jgi:hypothetical protein
MTLKTQIVSSIRMTKTQIVEDEFWDSREDSLSDESADPDEDSIRDSSTSGYYGSGSGSESESDELQPQLQVSALPQNFSPFITFRARGPIIYNFLRP